MSEKICCVPGCKESGGSHRVLHKFPNPEKEKERFNRWLYSISGDILSMNNEKIYKNRRVCHAHFTETHCCRYERISKIAVPLLNMPDPLQLSGHGRRSLRSIENIPSTSTEPSNHA